MDWYWGKWVNKNWNFIFVGVRFLEERLEGVMGGELLIRNLELFGL